ncbi:hypothetical protein QBC39DRAFT_368969 [Podospora conica]|nr:hypothetical protein QBC39DRAFT_368969 [Schizothecium conicum]
MKFATVATALFAAVAMAAPSAEAEVVEASSLPMRRDVVQTLDKRGCPAGASCQQGQCYWWNCAISGWCTANPSGIKC